MKDKNATVIIDLKNKSEEEIFEKIDYSRRKNIKKAIRRGLKFIKAQSNEIKKSHEIYSKVWLEGGISPMKLEKWNGLINKEDYILFTIKLEKEIVGSALIQKIDKKFLGIKSDDKGIRFRAFSSDKKFNEYRPNDFLYWNCIKYALENKLDFVDFGGWQINARGHLKGINRFKMQWGGEILFYKKDYPFIKAIGRKLIRNFGVFWWLNKKIKRIL
ncbi:MAG: peptidoglycan bridge formation glycyltransferase FemA/FemB family protein [Nanoarchaeota archaeon]|nr:peptidoglycan bridge formation glycyltransferase FemA/FemB family protein [Nanoarchaeota archaeon]